MEKQNNGYAYIKGVVEGFKSKGRSDDYITINYFDWSRKSPMQYFFKIDNNGHFSDSLYLSCTQDIILNCNGSFKTLFVSPKETNVIEINGSIIKSLNNTESELISIYFKDLKAIKGNSSNVAYASFREYRDYRNKIYKDELNLNKDFISKYNTSNLFSTWLTNFSTLKYYNDLTNYLISERRINFTDTIIPTIFSEILDSLSNKNSSYKLNSTYYFLLNNLTELVYKQVIFEGSCLNSIRSKNVKFNQVSEGSKNINVPIKEINKGIYLCFINSLGFIHNNEIRELLLTNKYLQLYEKENFDLCIDTVLNQLTDSLIIKNFLTQYVAITNLRSFNQKMVLNFNAGDRLLGDIQDKYPNKILCLIFWSTWCSPCYSHMLEIDANKNKLRSKNVHFVYLCCQSKQNIWEEKVKMLNIDGTHYFLDNAQYAFISQRFNITGFPKTILVSDGNFYTVSTHSTEQILREINKMEI